MYHVMTSIAKMPGGVHAPYKNVAIVKVADGFVGRPKMISERARGVEKIVRHYGPQFVGKTERSAFYRVMKDAVNEAARLNAALFLKD